MSQNQSIRRVGLVEIPDDALDLLSHYTQDPLFEVVLVVGIDPESYLMRMAEILQVPVADVANRLSLGVCDMVVVGPKPSDLVEEVRELVGGMPVEVYSVADACAEAGIGAEPVPIDPESLDWSESVDEFEIVPPGGSPRAAAPRPAHDALVIEHDIPDEDEPVAAGTGTAAAPSPAAAAPVPRPAPPPAVEPPPPPAIEPETAPADPAFDAIDSIDAIDAFDELAGADPADDLTEPVSGGFDVGPVLGEDLRDRVTGISLDTRENELLDRILDTAIQATHTQSGSIMLLDRDQQHLRIAVARGLPGHVVRTVRQRVGEGVAGEVFAGGKPRLLRGRVPRRGPDRDLRPRLRQAAVIPILSGEKPIGVLSVNLETDNLVLSEDTLALLSRFAVEIATAILKAIQIDAYEGPMRHEALLRQVERLMALDDPLPQRLLAVAGAAARAYRAEAHHIFLVDPLGKRLERLSTRSGRRLAPGDVVSLDRGGLGWVVRHQAPQRVVFGDARGAEAVSFLVPVRGAGTHGLLVLENAEAGADALAHLDEILQRVGEMIDVEKNLVAQEVLGQLQLRIQDEAPRFGSLLPHERARAVLEFSVDLLAADSAVWVPPGDARPIWTRPAGNSVAALQARFRRELDAVAQHIEDEGGGVARLTDSGTDVAAPAPAAFAPWTGVAAGPDGGALVLVFAPEDASGTPAQVPAPVLIRVLQALAAHLPRDLRRHVA